MKKSLLLLSLISTMVWAQIVDSDFTATDIATNLDTPWEILWGPDNKIWFTERGGAVKRVDPNTKQVETLITISDVYENSETGLLGMALHPDFLNDKPWVYLVYTYQNQSAPNGIVEKLVRYTYQNNTLASPQIILDNIKGNTTHTGSRLLFLPDKTLLMTTGEAQDQPLSQNPTSLNGKVLRMTDAGAVPADNPTANSLVYSIGHRNPQGLTYGNGKIYSSEHGANTDDEINIIEPSRNYGWPTVQGYCNTASEITFCSQNNIKEPIWSSGSGTEAVAGLDYYPATGPTAALRNSLFMVSLKIGTSRGRDLRVYKLSEDGASIVSGSESILFNNVYGRLRDLTISPAGDIYISTSNRDGRFGSNIPAADDRIIRLRPNMVTSATDQWIDQRQVFPNPVKDILYINQDNDTPVSLVHISGVDTYEFVVHDSHINVSQLPRGIYILLDSQKRMINKVVKM
ncbi:MAG TPA: PQQ-dependent sugar dehydrogenase [Cytophagales bacterium]|nr:PQQ-dependent sugar dehydrogenase [Cytophagales bacterium]